MIPRHSLCRLTLHIFYIGDLMYSFGSTKCLRSQLVTIRTPECHASYLYLSYLQYLWFEGTFVPVGTCGNYPWFSYLTGNYPLGSGKDFGFSGGTTTCR